MPGKDILLVQCGESTTINEPTKTPTTFFRLPVVDQRLTTIIGEIARLLPSGYTTSTESRLVYIFLQKVYTHRKSLISLKRYTCLGNTMTHFSTFDQSI